MFTISELKTNGGESGKQSLAAVDLLQSRAGGESRDAPGDHDVLRQRRPINDAKAVVEAQAFVDRLLEQELVQGLGMMKAEVAGVQNAADLRRDLKIGAGVEDENSRIHKAGLPFF